MLVNSLIRFRPFKRLIIFISLLFTLILFFILNNNGIKNRNEFGILLEKSKFSTMIEVGVQSGIFAEKVLSNWPSFKQYYGIDPWIQQKNYKDFANVDNNEQEKKYQETINRLKKYGNKIKLIRNFSTNAAVEFDNNSIDFIYIDARHDYCGVYEDLSSYYPKLKCNGIFGGHDFQPVGYETSDQDWSLCANGEKILKNGGAVKGKYKKHFVDEY